LSLEFLAAEAASKEARKRLQENQEGKARMIYLFEIVLVQFKP